ncbi:MAG: hypothetical protein JXB15_11015 [Anaerolineales bacterium]|nr:hypothetical protein [Anaerolineales bacterium]
MKKISAYLSIYLALFGCFVIGAWFVWRSFDTLTYLLAERKIEAIETAQSEVGRQSSLIAMGWTVFVSLILLIVLMYAESAFRKGTARGNLLQRIAGIYGPIILLIFLVDLVALNIRGWVGTWVYWLVLVLELGAGVGLLIYGRKKRASV